MPFLISFFIACFLFWPSLVWAQASTSTPSIDTETALRMTEDAQRVSACVQEVYDRLAKKTLEEDLVPALKKCYAGTALESYAQFPEEQPFKVDVSQFKDAFTDPRAQIDLQKAFDSITRNLTVQESQKVFTCFEDTKKRYDLSGPPSAALQKEFANCYRGTAFEPIAQVYDRIATRVDCANDRVGAQRVLEIVRSGAYTEQERDVVQRCVIERTAAVTTGVAAVNMVGALGMHNTGALLYFLFTQPFLFLSLRGRKTHWGTIYNRFTHRPVDLGIVRVLKSEKIFRTRVTDATGRYVFFVEPSAYTVSVSKQDYVTLPSIGVQAPQGVVNADIGIEPVVEEKGLGQLRFDRIRSRAHRFVAIVSPLIAITAAAISPRWWMILLAGISTALTYAFHKKLSRPKPTTFGCVVDVVNRQPVKNAVVRIFSLPWNKLVESTFTDSQGRYAFLVGEGTYILTAEKTNFKKTTTPQIKKTLESDGWIGEHIILGS